MAIIGLSGKKSSGKDTVGKIIQYLIEGLDKANVTWEQWDGNTLWNSKPHNWQIKKFAYAVKQVCSILTGIPIEDFEKEEVKNRLLGEEWIRYGYADGFIKKYIGNGNMGEPIMNNKQCSKEEYEEHYKTNWQTAYKSHLTVRELLQVIGTDLFRNQLHEDTWVNALMSEYKDTPYQVGTTPENLKWVYDENYPNWIITDVRFPNEAKAVKDRGGIIIRVNRKPFEWINIDEYEKLTGKKVKRIISHESETALDNYTFDYTIDNNGTIEELIEKVKLILQKEKII